MWFGEALWLIAAVLGLGFVVEKFFLAFAIIKFCGVAYLAYLAWKLWNAPSSIAQADLPEEGSALRLFLTGMALTLGNPKIMVFYLALLPSIIDLRTVSSLGFVELVTTALLVMMTVDLAWAFTASWGLKIRGLPDI